MVKRPVVLALILILLVPASLLAFEVQRPAKAMERAAAPFDRTEHFRQMVQLQQQLEAALVPLAEDSVLEVEITADERRAVREGIARERKIRVGVAKDLYVPLDFITDGIAPGRTRMHSVFGAVRGGADGGLTWSGMIRSRDAEALRVHFTDVHLPPGVELYVYSREGMAFGPYTGRGPNGDGEFWSNTIAGSEIVIQLEGADAEAARFTIAGVGHMTPEFTLGAILAPRPRADSLAPCGANASCVVDVQCTGRDDVTEMAAAKAAVAQILFVSGAWLYTCSGGLVADSDSATAIPYFITANHCVSKGGEANSLETFFGYVNATCGSCTARGAKSTTGSSILSTNRTSDYTLLRLSQPAPSSAAFLGWSTADFAGSAGASLYRVSHPRGAPQAYSEHSVDVNAPTCRSWPRGAWIYSRDAFGATEGGSSGSPVVNRAGQLVGQLSGACGYNVNDVCDATSNATVDGAFAAYYNSVASWLGAGDAGGGGDPPTCIDADGDGYCSIASGGDDCDDNDAKVYPGANDTKGKQGRDGIDNDCNGIIDG